MKIILIAFAVLLFSGCASVPMESDDKAEIAKSFRAPPEGKSGLYVYRSGVLGGALKKDIRIDGECIGETAPNIFFYKEVDGDKSHRISTESEFSPNDLVVMTQSGLHYFIRQYIKMGLFVGGAGLELVDEDEGMKDVSNLKMAKQGSCGS